MYNGADFGAFQRLHPTLTGSVSLAFLTAFTDDSASEIGDKRLFMAGYLNRAENWALFSEAWHEELRAAPAIDYAKMAEAHNLSGQFHFRNGWDEKKRDEKLRGLVRVVRHFKPLSFHFSVDRCVYFNELKPVSPWGLSPHFTGVFGIVSSVTQYLAKDGVRTPVEFVFDEQNGVDEDIKLFFSYMKRNIPSKARRLIDRDPIFKNDKGHRYLPLQAADLLAWHFRREHESGGGVGSLPMANELRNPDGHLAMDIPNEMLRSWAAHHSKQPGIAIVAQKKGGKAIKREIKQLLAQGIDPSKINGPGIYYPEGRPILTRLTDTIKRLFKSS